MNNKDILNIINEIKNNVLKTNGDGEEFRNEVFQYFLGVAVKEEDNHLSPTRLYEFNHMLPDCDYDVNETFYQVYLSYKDKEKGG